VAHVASPKVAIHGSGVLQMRIARKQVATATSMFRKPVTLVALLAMGSATLRGTLPSAA
jgi:hypothetical protein